MIPMTLPAVAIPEPEYPYVCSFEHTLFSTRVLIGAAVTQAVARSAHELGQYVVESYWSELRGKRVIVRGWNADARTPIVCRAGGFTLHLGTKLVTHRRQHD